MNGKHYAFDAVAPHQSAPLGEGGWEGAQNKPPPPGGKSDKKPGAEKTLPAVKAVPTHEIKIEDGVVYVALNPKRVKIGGGRGRRR